jgi:hypothetical protein
MADGWTVTTAVATAFASLGAAVSAFYAYNQVTDQRHVAEVQAVSSLTTQASDLYGEFKRVGIDDVPRLTSHLYLRWTYKDRGIISRDFYTLQAKTWCSLTRKSTDKLNLYWQNDPSFRAAYANQPQFLALLDALVDKSPTAPKDCL